MGFGNLFGKLAVRCMNNKCIALCFCLTITGIFSLGILNLKMENDPQNLWVKHTGRTWEE